MVWVNLCTLKKTFENSKGKEKIYIEVLPDKKEVVLIMGV